MKKIILTSGIIILLTMSAIFVYLRKPIEDISLPRTPKGGARKLAPELSEVRYDQSTWEKQVLKRFRAENISRDAHRPEITIYRLILFPTFDPPVMITIRKDDLDVKIITKTLSGVGGYGEDELGTLASEQERSLTNDEWTGFLQQAEESEFWYESRYVDQDPVMDGAFWVLEAIHGDYHHTVERISPAKGLIELFDQMLILSGLREKYTGYY